MRETVHQKWSLSSEAFHGFLAALDSDPNRAAERYLEIRRNLVRLFEWRGSATPDECADETFNRCARKIGEGEQIRDVATFCVGIARMLLREKSRNRIREPRSLDQAPEPHALQSDDTDNAMRLECLRHCLERLPAEERELILNYYQGDKSEKINRRRKITETLGIPPSTLRMRALRIREKLQSWAERYMESRMISRNSIYTLGTPGSDHSENQERT